MSSGERLPCSTRLRTRGGGAAAGDAGGDLGKLGGEEVVSLDGWRIDEGAAVLAGGDAALGLESVEQGLDGGVGPVGPREAVEEVADGGGAVVPEGEEDL